jgi:uncharacterized membrane protein
MSKRIIYIDLMRGFAVFQMIFWQIFDFFSKIDIYKDIPLYIAVFNMPINGIGVGLFSFISGICVYLSVNKRITKGFKKKQIFIHILKRYGGYIILSLVFTLFVFDFNTFFTFQEVIQGIGLSALISGILFLIIQSENLFFVSGILLILIQPFLRIFINNFLQSYSVGIILNFLLNAFFKGFFSLSNLLPFFLIGIYFGTKINNFKNKKFLFYGFLFLIISIILHFSYTKIDYYNFSSSYQFFYIGLCLITLSFCKYISNKFNNSIFLNFFIIFGKSALFSYILHFLFIYKILKLFNINDSFDIIFSIVFSIAFVVMINQLAKIWRRFIKNFQDRNYFK